MKKWTSDQIPSQQGKIIIVTGANAGLGFATSEELVRKGATVIMAVRDQEKGEKAKQKILSQAVNAEVDVQTLDLSDLVSVKAFARRINHKYPRIDTLINNAGVMKFDGRSESVQGFELQLATNHLGHFLLTKRLLPLLEQSHEGRIVVVSSLVTNMKAAGIYFDDLHFQQGYDRMKAYAQSKLANLMFVLDLADKLKQSGSKVKVVAAHPGYTATDLQRHMGIAGVIMNALMAQSVEMGRLPQLRAATDTAVLSGEYYGPANFSTYRGYPKVCKMTDLAMDKAVRDKLWQLTEVMVGETF